MYTCTHKYPKHTLTHIYVPTVPTKWLLCLRGWVNAAVTDPLPFFLLAVQALQSQPETAFNESYIKETHGREVCVCVQWKRKDRKKGVGHHRMLGFVSAAEKSAEGRENTD